ncbi:transglycosylase SLT domain-containing protein [Streptomyces sp. NBC_01142]|uniref:transglycosylase SLT domain-containing protein n=1 Tax=Streptomyces sp. NBC_01142 TaxID=2975865 RepID=UPI00224FA0B1|nr:transglycosylase SLT domain-containing protein [Streptomyces sp. NBC_01142]MCX4822145.1 transglycosylase SLT domain-containing protein [Streptomyces sp. NBC_01142]
MSASSNLVSRLKKTQKMSIAGVSAVAAAALAFSLVPGNASANTETQALAAAPVAFSSAPQATTLQAGVAKQQTAADQQAKAAAKAAADAKKKAADAKKAAKAKADAKKRATAQAASRAAARKPVYANNLDGWIREALAIMKNKNIPGSYDGLHRNIIRESSGNPRAINNWDINAINGIPSKGLLQVIKPTFDAYHVAGTPHDQYHPVANIVAAANYAADRYGSIDNVNSAY